MYFTRVIDYNPMTKKMAEELETVINEVCEQEKAEFITFSITNNAKFFQFDHLQGFHFLCSGSFA